MIKLMIVEDNDIVREGLSHLLAGEAGITIVADAEHGAVA